jgi:hypothetical protein
MAFINDVVAGTGLALFLSGALVFTLGADLWGAGFLLGYLGMHCLVLAWHWEARRRVAAQVVELGR